jgi:hypothetical protein
VCLPRIAIALFAIGLATAPAHAQTLRRLKGRVTAETGGPIANADVRVEALFGYAGGTFAGQRLFDVKTDGRGEWSVMGIKSGVWRFAVAAPGYVPEVVVLPIQLLTTESSGMSGVALTWPLILKMAPVSADANGERLSTAAASAFGSNASDLTETLGKVPDGADANYLAGAGRVCLVAGQADLARALFTKALEQDSASYRAALGIASTFMLQRDFDSASRAFDAARSRTKDKDEQKFLTVALGDLATIRVR